MPTNGMTIDGLNTVSALTAQDKVPVWDNESSGEPTRKITAQNMANSVKTLGNLVNTTEMNTAIAQSTAVETGTPTIRIIAGSTELSKTITASYYKKFKNFVFLYVEGTFDSSASGGIYMVVLSGAPRIPADHCFLTGTITVKSQPVFPLHSGASVYFRLADNTNYQGDSISGKNFKISLLYVVE